MTIEKLFDDYTDDSDIVVLEVALSQGSWRALLDTVNEKLAGIRRGEVDDDDALPALEDIYAELTDLLDDAEVAY